MLVGSEVWRRQTMHTAASKSWTETPFWSRANAHVSPTTPAPTSATLRVSWFSAAVDMLLLVFRCWLSWQSQDSLYMV